ncbi:hypothetical protein ACFYN3_37480 [Streptomyces lavendulae]|uniref:hypothetical protein n=1 Tax=Streptomyces lavendulae TaxID=1914 RepID=UPI0033EE9B58
MLHATTDLAATLRRIAGLLADGGHLLALESHSHDALAPVFGLLDTFWEARDTSLRSEGPLLALDRWAELLHECGFTGTEQTGDPGAAALGDYSVILTARRPRTQAPGAGLLKGHPAEGARGRHWLVGTLPCLESGDGRMADAVVTALRERTENGTVRTAPAVDDDGWQSVLSHERPTDLVLLASADGTASPIRETETAVRQLAVLRAISAACVQAPGSDGLTVWLLGHSNDVVFSPSPVTGGAALWGGARTLANEHPSLTVRKIALTGVGDAESQRALAERGVREMLHQRLEDEVLLTPRAGSSRSSAPCRRSSRTAPAADTPSPSSNPACTTDWAGSPRTCPHQSAARSSSGSGLPH